MTGLARAVRWLRIIAAVVATEAVLRVLPEFAWAIWIEAGTLAMLALAIAAWAGIIRGEAARLGRRRWLIIAGRAGDSRTGSGR